VEIEASSNIYRHQKRQRAGGAEEKGFCNTEGGASKNNQQGVDPNDHTGAAYHGQPVEITKGKRKGLWGELSGNEGDPFREIAGLLRKIW